MGRDSLMRSLFQGVNEAIDPHNLTDLEKRHIPTIEAPSPIRAGEPFCATVRVGAALSHPNERSHFIEFIELYADDAFLARVSLTAASTEPEVSLSVCLSAPAGRLRALARCNMHGTWVGTAPITMAE
jgi:superoxide reductase